MRGSRKFCQRGSDLDDVFLCVLVDEGREDPNLIPLKAAFRWWADNAMSQH